MLYLDKYSLFVYVEFSEICSSSESLDSKFIVQQGQGINSSQVKGIVCHGNKYTSTSKFLGNASSS